MIYIIGEYGVYNREAAIFGIKSLFDREGIDCQIITPSIDIKQQKNRAAILSKFKAGTIWSIYDCFTGRTMLDEERLTPDNYEAPEGYIAEAGFASLHYRKDNEKLELKLRADGSIESVEHFERDVLISRDVYDDGGQLVAHEYPLGEDTLSKLLDMQGDTIFELYLTGKYRKVTKVRYVREKLDFLSEAAFWEWAFLQLLQNKQENDKFFILSEAFRKAIVTSNFSKLGVYLLPSHPLDENKLQDIQFDHYEKLVFNSHDELDKIAVKFDERTNSKLYWNNYITTEFLQPNYELNTFPVFLNLGSPSPTVDFDVVADSITEILTTEAKVSFAIEFTLLRDQVDFLNLLKSKGLSEEELKTRVTAMTRPFPETREAAMAASVLYIHYQNSEMISQPLMLAIAGEKPILALSGDPLLNDYLEDNNGKMISETSLARLIKQIIYDVEFIKYVAPNPGVTREKFSDTPTMERWVEIFDDKGQKI
ncbi:MAG: hypothetical protein LBV19_01350 [Streptococcaceae bacterium]|nr:hypothetical protein [Streptococcaceae bacterium]